MDALFSPTVPPLERFDRYFDYVHDRLAELQEKCGSILGCPILSIGSEVSTQDQGVRATVDRIWDRKIKYFESAYPDAHAQELIVAPDAEAKGEGALCLLSRDARSGANSKRRRVASRFQAGRDGCPGRETPPRYFLMSFFFAIFIERPVKYNRKESTHAN